MPSIVLPYYGITDLDKLFWKILLAFSIQFNMSNKPKDRIARCKIIFKYEDYSLKLTPLIS